jgi:hypothetical protein
VAFVVINLLEEAISEMKGVVKSRRKYHTLNTKLKAVQLSWETSVKGAAREYKVAPKSIR